MAADGGLGVGKMREAVRLLGGSADHIIMAPWHHNDLRCWDMPWITWDHGKPTAVMGIPIFLGEVENPVVYGDGGHTVTILCVNNYGR